MSRTPREDKDDLKRVQMDLPPKAIARLQELQRVTEAASYAEVMRSALRLYEVLVLEHKTGGRILIERDDSPNPTHIYIM